MKLSTIFIYALLLYLAVHIYTLPLSIVAIVLSVCLGIILIIKFQKQPHIAAVLNTLKALF